MEVSKGTLAHITLVGRIGADAEIFGKGETQVLTFNMAVTTGTGQYEATTWYQAKLIAKGPRLEAVSGFARKGARVLVQGEPCLVTFDRRDGSTGSKIEVLAREIMPLDPREERAPEADAHTRQMHGIGGRQGGARQPDRRPAAAAFVEDLDDDVPF